MENTFDCIEPLFEKIKDYGKTSLELFKLKTISSAIKIVTTFVFQGVIVIIVSLFLIFASIGLALWLGDLFGKLYLGFFCVATFYIVLAGVIFSFFKNIIKRKLSNYIISKVLNT
jgi:hypothetical protein